MSELTHHRAHRLAERIQAELADACERIEIAGSIRREKPVVKDLELVAIPKVAMGGLLGDIAYDLLDHRVAQLVAAGKLCWRDRDGEPCAAPAAKEGRRYYRLRAVAADAAIDLFVVRPPAQWGCIFAIRTGPAEYSRELVTRAQRRGLRCTGGHLEVIATGEIVPTPEEADFIRACGFAPVAPRDRRL